MDGKLDGVEDANVEGLLLGEKEGTMLRLGDTDALVDGKVEVSNVGMLLCTSVGVGVGSGEVIGLAEGIVEGATVISGAGDVSIGSGVLLLFIWKGVCVMRAVVEGVSKLPCPEVGESFFVLGFSVFSNSSFIVGFKVAVLVLVGTWISVGKELGEIGFSSEDGSKPSIMLLSKL